MWQDATPVAAGGTPAAPAPVLTTAPARTRRPRSERDLVLWAQILLCCAALAAVLAARAVGAPLFARLRVAYTAALTADPQDALAGECRFVRFAQQTLADLQTALADTAREVLASLDAPADDAAAPTPDAASAPADSQSTAPSTAGLTEPAAVSAAAVPVRHGKAAPVGSSLQSYRPAFSLLDPLGGTGWTNTSSYGWRVEPVSGKGSNFHTGTDLAAAEGTPVQAAAAGVVRYAGHGASYGNYVRVLHDGGDETLYAHLQYLFVHAGQRVAAGETLGTVGQTGHVTGPHLHFELLHQGVRYDPAQALQAAG